MDYIRRSLQGERRGEKENLLSKCQLRGMGMCVSVALYAQEHLHFIYMHTGPKQSFSSFCKTEAPQIDVVLTQ